MRVVLLLLTIIVVVDGWTRLKWGHSDIRISENSRGSGTIKYYYRKATFPICHRIDISASYSYGRQGPDGNSEFPNGNAFDRYDTNNYHDWRKVLYRWERGWVYEGLLVPRENWLVASFTFYCHRNRHGNNLIESITATTTRSVQGILGVMVHPYNGKISLSLAVTDWNYHYFNVYCYYEKPREVAVANFQCYPMFGKYLRKHGMIVIDCGTTVPYGITDFTCQASPKRPAKFNYGRNTYVKAIWWPTVQAEATKPMQPFLRPPVYKENNDSSNGVLTIPYVSLRYSLQDSMAYVITHDARFSTYSFANISGNFVPAKRTESCDPAGGIGVNGTAVISQSSEFGGYPASNAANGKLDDFSHTMTMYDQWWMVRKDDWPGIGYLVLRLRRNNWSRAKKLTILTAKQAGALVPSLSDNRWTKHFYQEAATPNAILEFQFLPVVQLNYLAIYSQNPTDALELSEVITEGSCVKTSMQEMKLPIGLDFIVTARSMIQRTGAVTDDSYNRFSTIPMNGSMVARELCLTYKYEALRDYFGCTDSNSINPARMADCQARKLGTLKELLACLDPDVPVDPIQEDLVREEKIVKHHVDPFNVDWGWFK